MTRSRELAELASAYDSGGALGFRNRIINGDMRIDQRNNGASIAPASSTYSLDRWRIGISLVAGSLSFQRVVDAPPGFTHSIKCTVNTSATPAASDLCYIHQPMEGSITADFAFGTASASPVTVSFWVKSSVLGIKSASLLNGDATRSYSVTYNINAANTWEYKTITIPGDTTGTWATDISAGLNFHFNVAIGSNFELTNHNEWVAGRKYTTAATPDFLSSAAGSTLFITGVQLEKGSVATPFAFRSIGQELQLCQRYIVVYGGGSTYERLASASSYSATQSSCMLTLPVQMRTIPSITASGNWNDELPGLVSALISSFGLDSNGSSSKILKFDVTHTSNASFGSNKASQITAGNDLNARFVINAEV